MKRILSLLLALSMIIAITATLSSCDMLNQLLPGETEDVITVEDGYLVVNGVKTEYKVLVEDENNDQNGNEENNGQPDNKEVRTTVTKEEFVENLIMKNFTSKATATVPGGVSAADGSASDAYVTYNIKFTATASYLDAKIRDSLGNMKISGEEYCVLQDGVFYRVQENDNGYIGEVSSEHPWRSILPFQFDFYETPETAEEYYDLFVYDEEEKSYTTEDSSFALYFENGKIVKMVIPFGTNIDMIHEISNIGTTVVEAPEFTIVDNSASGETAE